MPRHNDDTSTLSVLHPICCGMDVHKDMITACLMWTDPGGIERSETVEWETFTDSLIQLREWLIERGCPIVAMESTGPYWTPIHNVLEDYLEVVLVNPRRVKNVPGRKTDISDSRWLAGLLRYGLVEGGFIPPKFQRQWRDLTRTRRSYVKSAGDFKRRVHKLFQHANVKIDSVVSNLFGLTGRNLMKLLAAGGSMPTLEQVQQCLRGSLTAKAEELYRSVQGFFDGHHRKLLRLLLATIETLEDQIAQLDREIRAMMTDQEDVISRLNDIPGIADVSGRAVLSETGPTLKAFASASALGIWCGLAPSNNESAGKRRNTRTRVAKNHLKEIMIEVAWAAIKTKGSYFKAKYYALKARLGPKKAIVAVAHRLLKVVYHVIKLGATFKDLGEDYLVKLNRESKLKYLKKQAALLGFELTPLTPPQQVGPIFLESERSLAN
jgi:transposase